MGIVQQLRDEASELRLKSHLAEAEYSADHERIIEILERQAIIIEILGKIDRDHLKRFTVED